MRISRTRNTGHRNVRRFVFFSVVAWLSGVSLWSHANTAETKTLSLAEAIDRTLKHHPDIQAYPYYLRQAEGRALQADVGPSPTLDLSMENVFGSGSYSGTDVAEYNLGLSQVIELGSKRKQRIGFADASNEVTQAEYELTRLDVLAETSKRFYQTLHTQALISWAENKQRVESQALNAIKRRAQSGAVMQADVSNLKLHLARTTQQLANLNNLWQLQKLWLSAMWLDESDFNSVSGSLSQLPSAQTYDALVSQIASFPEYIVHFSQQRLADQQVALSKANGRANLELGVGIRQYSDSSDSAFMLTASMPLQFSNPNRGRIAEALASAELSSNQLVWNKQALQLSLKQLWMKLEAANKLVADISNSTLPLAKAFQQQARQAYQKGQFSVLQLLNANDQVFSLEKELIDQQLSFLNLLLEIERVTGTPIIREQNKIQNSQL